MNFNLFYCYLYDIAVLAGVTTPCKPKNFKEAKCLLVLIKDALSVPVPT
jgi:hypothetical protein